MLFSGMTCALANYSLVSRGARNALTSISKLTLVRWLRYGPAIVALLAIDFAWPLCGSGPMFSELAARLHANCAAHWPKAVLMANNDYDDWTRMCLTHTWYVSAEFQLFVVALAAILLLKTHERLGLSVCGVLIAVGMIVPAWRVCFDGQDPALIEGFASMT